MNKKTCRKEFDEKDIERYWIQAYEKIDDVLVARKLFQSAKILGSNQKANVFCQRAVQDLTDVLISVDGRFDEETIDAINFAIRSGLAGQLQKTTAHYVANYVQFQVSPKEYGEYLKVIFD